MVEATHRKGEDSVNKLLDVTCAIIILVGGAWLVYIVLMY